MPIEVALNVLRSFAHFEREVTSERNRDEISALFEQHSVSFGSVSTMSNALIRDAGASGEPRCRPSWMPCLSRRRK
jgi:hypothetical protein